MGKVTTNKLRVGERDDFFYLEYTVYVNTSGLFTTTLKVEDVAIVEAYGLELSTNGRRNARKGYFEATTMKELERNVSETLQQCYSREEVSREWVIRYAFKSSCSFVLAKTGEIHPNGSLAKGEQNVDWRWMNGTETTNAANPAPTEVGVYMGLYEKITYKYRKGDTKTEYVNSHVPKMDNLPDGVKHFGGKLANLVSQKTSRGMFLKDLPYTEDRAEFFLNVWETLCLLSVQVRQLNNPEQLQAFIEDKGQLKLGK